MADLPISAIKLHIPPTQHRLVPRPRLMTRLDEALSRRLTVVSAPAGFGKTTLLSQWCARRPAGMPVVWLSLDERDDNAPRFWRCVLAALDGPWPEAAAAARPLLEQFPPTIQPAISTLAHALSQVNSVGCVLVLDNFGSLRDPAIHRSMDAWLELLPPWLHLALVGRTDPPLQLERWRADGALDELRAPDLCFSPLEAHSYFNDILSLGLADAETAALNSVTQGRPAAVHLAAHCLAMRPATERAGFSAALAGAPDDALAHLLDEAFQHLPLELQTFLLHTCVLDQLSAPLCDSLSGRRRGQAILEHLAAQDLFLLPLDSSSDWFGWRPWAADALRARLARQQPHLLRECHGRAALWFEAHGMRLEAIRHALAADEAEAAAEWVERDYRLLIMSGALGMLEAWLGALPVGLVRERATLAVAAAWVSAYAGRGGELDAYLADVLRALPALDRRQADTLRAECLALQAVCAAVCGDPASAMVLAQRALEAAPESDAFLETVITAALGEAHLGCAHAAQAAEACARVETLSQPWRSPYVRLASRLRLGQACAAQGQLRAAAASYQQALRLAAAADGAALPYIAETHVRLAEVYYQWNDLPAAWRHVQQGLALGRQARHAPALLAGALAAARLNLAHGHHRQAQAAIQHASQTADGLDTAAARAEVAAHAAWLDLAQGRTNAAQLWALTVEADANAADLPAAVCERQQLVGARVLLAHGQAERALRQLSALIGAARTAGRLAGAFEAVAIQALAYQVLGLHTEVVRTLATALTLADADGWVRLFLDEGAPMQRALRAGRAAWASEAGDPALAVCAHRLLDAFTSQARQPGTLRRRDARPPEALTPRELEMLALVGQGASNHAVAEQLEVNSVMLRGQLNQILDKLGARSRSDAAVYARNLGLLDS